MQSDKKKSQGGFSLVELIVSIAVVAILGALVLQLFVSAEVLNRKAGDIDKSISISVAAIELYRGGVSPENFSEYGDFGKAAREGGLVVFYYGDKWVHTDNADCEYVLTFDAEKMYAKVEKVNAYPMQEKHPVLLYEING